MPRASKPVYIRCPRCELNYITKGEQYCDVCKKELKMIASNDDDISDLELCPICKMNFVQGEEICESCKQELNMKSSDDDDEDSGLSDDNWQKYVADDDEEDDEDIVNDDGDNEDIDTSGVLQSNDDIEFSEDKDIDIGFENIDDSDDNSDDKDEDDLEDMDLEDLDDSDLDDDDDDDDDDEDDEEDDDE